MIEVLRRHLRSRTSCLLPIAVFLFSSVVFWSTVNEANSNNDVSSAGIGAWRIAESGSPWLESAPEGSYPTERTWLTTTPDGHTVIARSPGVIAVSVPGYVLASTAGEGEFDPAPQAITAAIVMALTVTMVFLLLSPYLSRAAALAGAGVFGFATPVWSIAADGVWTHTLTVPGIIGMALAASRERWWLVGLLGGVALWGRLHTVIIVAALGLAVAALRRRPAIAVRVALPSLAMLGLASLWSFWHYDSWMPSGAYTVSAARVSDGFGDDSTATLANQLGLWVSPDRGFLVWTPLVLVLLPALVRSWRGLPDWAKVLPFAGLGYTLVQGQLNTFTGGDGFYGYRHTLELLACLTPCLALSAPAMGRWARHVVGPLAGAQVAAFALGAISEGWYVTYDRAWYDNSFALALRHEPTVIVWVALMVVVGFLTGALWRQRLDDETPTKDPIDDSQSCPPATVGGHA